ncbi:MAG: hypothetical protein ACFFCQ_00155 [Promethearchaeota archaeon]
MLDYYRTIIKNLTEYNWPIVADTEEIAHSVGIIVGALGIVVMIGCAYRLYTNYIKTEKKQSLYLAGFWFFLGIAALLVGIEQILFRLIDNTDAADPATFFAILAFSSAICGFFLGNLFALSFFSEEKMKLVAIPSILLIAYFGYWLLTIHFNASAIPGTEGVDVFAPWRDTGVDMDMYRTGAEKGILVLLMFIPVWFIFTVLAYATYEVRAQLPLFKRSFLLTILQAGTNVAYTIEIIGTDFLEPVLGDAAVWMVVLARINYVLIPLFVYIVYAMPQWFKVLIGWE